MTTNYNTSQPRFFSGKGTTQWDAKAKIYELCEEHGHIGGMIPKHIAHEMHMLYGPHGNTAKVIKPKNGEKVSVGSCTDRWNQSRIMIAVEKGHDVPWQWLENYATSNAPDATGDDAKVKASRDVKRAVSEKQDVSWRSVQACLLWLDERSWEYHRALKRGPRNSVASAASATTDVDRQDSRLPNDSGSEFPDQVYDDLQVTAGDRPSHADSTAEHHVSRSAMSEHWVASSSPRSTPNGTRPDHGASSTIGASNDVSQSDHSPNPQESSSMQAVEAENVKLREEKSELEKENAEARMAIDDLSAHVAVLQARLASLQQSMRGTRD